MLRRVIPVVYLMLGVLIAAQNSYLAHLNTISRTLSAALAILLWPLVLAGVSLHVA